MAFGLLKMQVAGAEVLVSQIIDKVSDWVEPTVFCLDGVGTLGEELIGRGIPVVDLERRPGVIDWSVSKRLHRELVSRRIELLHAHQYSPLFYAVFAKMRGALEVKVLMTEHGRAYPDLVSPKRRWVNRLVLSRFVNHSTACCKFSANALEKNDGFPRVEVLYNGIDVSKHHLSTSEEERRALRVRLGLQEGIQYIACIARFHPVKDHGTLVRAFGRVASRLERVRLLLVGTGEEEGSIRNLVRETGLSERVEFWGVRRDVGDILRACDAFSLTSVSEAASLTLLESMANGCPVAITDVGGNSEHVTHESEGLLSPRGDDVSLAKNLELILTDRKIASDFAKRARLKVEERFQLRDALARYEELYKQLLGRDPKN